MKNNIVKIAKHLIKENNKDELYSLFLICKKAKLDISKNINYDYKKKFKDSKVLMITLNLENYFTEDKYVEDYIRCYIEIDNMVEEGVESISTVQSKGKDIGDIKEKIIERLRFMKKEIVKEILIDLEEDGKDPESFFSNFKILYHYIGNTEKELSSIKKEIQEEISKKDFEEIKQMAKEEVEELMKIIKENSSGGDL